MPPILGIVLKVASYIVDFIIGFAANGAWEKWKRRNKTDQNSFSVTENLDRTVTVDMHVKSSQIDAAESASIVFSSLSGAREKVNH